MVRYYDSAPFGVDPARGSFYPSRNKRRGPYRPNKTAQDKMPAAKRARVQKALDRLPPAADDGHDPTR